MIRFICAISVLFFLTANCYANNTVSVVSFSSTGIGRLAAEKVRERLRNEKDFVVADADLTRSAAMGVGYAGSLNLSLDEARDLGAALATDYYLLGDAQVLRRSSFAKPVYFEAYCSIFLVSSRTGRLLSWNRPSFENDDAGQATELLVRELTSGESGYRLVIAMRRAADDERTERSIIQTSPVPLITEAPDDEKAAAAQGLRLPRPYRRMRPEYPESAARAEVEATVDVSVDVNADGEIADAQIVRWAGFGLDEATLATVRQLHFFPAMKNGTAIPMRVLLRYNFRKPPR